MVAGQPGHWTWTAILIIIVVGLSLCILPTSSAKTQVTCNVRCSKSSLQQTKGQGNCKCVGKGFLFIISSSSGLAEKSCMFHRVLRYVFPYVSLGPAENDPRPCPTSHNCFVSCVPYLHTHVQNLSSRGSAQMPEERKSGATIVRTFSGRL